MVTVAGMLDVKSDAKTGMQSTTYGSAGCVVRQCVACGRWAYLPPGSEVCSVKCGGERKDGKGHEEAVA